MRITLCVLLLICGWPNAIHAVYKEKSAYPKLHITDENDFLQNRMVLNRDGNYVRSQASDRQLTSHISNSYFSDFPDVGFGSQVISVQGMLPLNWYDYSWGPVMLFVALCLLLLYLAMYLYRMRRNNVVQQLQVADRTRELEETLDILKASETQLRKQGQMQQRLITAITHDIKSPMRHLLMVSGRGEANAKVLGGMHESIYRMYHLVDNLIDYMKMPARAQVGLELTDIYVMLEEKAGIFRPIAEARKVQVINDTPQNILAPVNRQLLAVVLNNLLDNAVKYTSAGQVSMTAMVQNDKLHISISDTGMGMPPELRMWIYEKQHAASEPVPAVKHGVGLMMVIELLQQINGELFVYDNEQQGTIVKVVLQLT